MPSRWLQFVLSTPVVLWAGWPFFVRGWRSLVNRNLNMFTLIAIGVGAAYVLQRGRHAGARHVSALVSAARKDRRLFEAAAVITVLVLLGQVLELRARSRTGSAIRALLDLAPPSRISFAMARNARCRSRKSGAVISSACARARRSRWMAG